VDNCVPASTQPSAPRYPRRDAQPRGYDQSNDSLASDTELSVPDATLPNGLSFDSGAVVRSDDFHSASLSYTDGEESISITTHTELLTSFDHSDSDRYEAVEVGDTTGYVYTSDDFLALYVEADQPYPLRRD